MLLCHNLSTVVVPPIRWAPPLRCNFVIFVACLPVCLFVAFVCVMFFVVSLCCVVLLYNIWRGTFLWSIAASNQKPNTLDVYSLMQMDGRLGVDIG